MKHIYLLLIFIGVNYSWAQTEDFKRPYPYFESCISSEDKKKCFDIEIKAIVLNVITDDAKSYFKRDSTHTEISMYVNFIIDENGKAIENSIRSKQILYSSPNKKVKQAIINLPKIFPVKNEYNFPILYYYSTQFNVGQHTDGSIIILEEEENNDDIDDDSTEFGDDFAAPLYPGCEPLSNEKRIKCFSKKVKELIGRKFKVDKAIKNFEPFGTFNMYLYFNINKKGKIETIEAYSPGELISQELIKTIKKIRKIKPGTSDDFPVIVPYFLPLKIIIPR